MSWSASFTLKAGETEPREGDLSLSNVNEVQEHLEQFREALASAFGILLSGVVGDKDKDYRIKFAGHGNPGHVPLEDHGNDWVLIEITQLTGESDK